MTIEKDNGYPLPGNYNSNQEYNKAVTDYHVRHPQTRFEKAISDHFHALHFRQLDQGVQEAAKFAEKYFTSVTGPYFPNG